MSSTEEPGAGMRDKLVNAAVRLLAEEGPQAVQARRLAREVGVSTMAVYHYFGGMSQLQAAVIDEGFRRLDARLAAVGPSDDSVADLARQALAYRERAWENPHLYDLMFGLSASQAHRPDEHGTQGESAHTPSQRAYGHLVTGVDRAMRAGRLQHGDPAHIAAQFWSILHGYVTLEMSGHFDQIDGLTEVFIPMGINLLIGLGDTPERATQSTTGIQQAEPVKPLR